MVNPHGIAVKLEGPWVSELLHKSDTIYHSWHSLLYLILFIKGLSGISVVAIVEHLLHHLQGHSGIE